jgi:hypothetical protein
VGVGCHERSVCGDRRSGAPHDEEEEEADEAGLVAGAGARSSLGKQGRWQAGAGCHRQVGGLRWLDE